MNNSATLDAANDGSLVDNFGNASLIVVLGVCLSWFVLKMNSEAGAVVLPAIPAFAWSNSAVAVPIDEELSLVERAERAFAAGKIGEPAQQSALYFYQQAQLDAPEDTDIKEGLARVASHLLGTAESSVFRNDWSGARSYTELAMQAEPQNAQAKELLVRIERYQRVEQLIGLAVYQVSQRQLTAPKGNNALASYRRVLQLDPGNEAATQGVLSLAQRLLASAQSAAFAGDSAQANRLIAKVKSFAPNAPGLAETERLGKQWRQMSNNQALQGDLLAAAEALREDKLVAPKGENALELFRSVLAKDPDSQAAARGLDLVAQELVSRAWTLLGSQDFAGATQAVADAESAGAQASLLAELTSEIEHQNRLANAREGRVDLVLAMSQLNPIKKSAPEYPKRASSQSLDGWVMLEFTVSPAGDVVEASVLSSSNEVFNRAALNAINGWRFEPHMLDGRAVPVRSGVKFSFQP